MVAARRRRHPPATLGGHRLTSPSTALRARLWPLNCHGAGALGALGAMLTA